MSGKNILIVSRYTFLELYKSKVMTSVLILGMGLLLISYVASEFTYGVPAKIAVEFGFGVTSLASVGISIFLGASLVAKEIETRTIYMVLSRPVSRVNFLLGKILGMQLMIFLNVAFLGTLTYLLYVFLGGGVGNLMFWTVLFIFFESFILLLFVVLFSLTTNTVLTVIMSLLLFLAGHSIEDAKSLPLVKRVKPLEYIIEGYSMVFPNFSKINLKQYVLYDQFLPTSYLWNGLFYSILYSLALTIVCLLIFRWKSLD